LSGPTSSQVEGLLKTLPKGKGMSKEEMFEIMLGKAQSDEFLTSVKYDVDKNKWIDKTNGKYYVKESGIENTTCVLKDSVKVNKIENAPKLIIIDEATHFNTVELQIISKFARENEINVILLGDDHQNGFRANGLMYNFDRESVLAWRAPNLFISLRDNNV
jgi:DNA transposition AAA+ family ATPase